MAHRISAQTIAKDLEKTFFTVDGVTEETLNGSPQKRQKLLQVSANRDFRIVHNNIVMVEVSSLELAVDYYNNNEAPFIDDITLEPEQD